MSSNLSRQATAAQREFVEKYSSEMPWSNYFLGAARSTCDLQLDPRPPKLRHAPCIVAFLADTPPKAIQFPEEWERFKVVYRITGAFVVFIPNDR